MPPPIVRPQDVVKLLVPGDNGVTKQRYSVVLDGYPSPHAPAIVAFIFGCSETKSATRRFVRVHDTEQAFRTMQLDNATTFHYEDIRLYDAKSPKLERKHSTCPRSVFLELRKLWDERLDDIEPLQLLPDKATVESKTAAEEFETRRVATKPSE